MTLIYKHYSKTFKKYYIGTTTQESLSKRIGFNGINYFYIKNNRIILTKLVKTIMNVGWKDFESEVILECPDKYAGALESYFIIYFNTYRNGYNSTLGAYFNEAIPGNANEYKKRILELENTDKNVKKLVNKALKNIKKGI